MQVLGVIPARYASSRFPGKPLADIAGKSMIERMWDQVGLCQRLDAAVVATDDQRIFDHVRDFGGEVLLTSANHASGTDRLGEVAQKLPADYYVNIQGDEPLLPPDAIDALVAAALESGAGMSTLVHPLDKVRDAAEVNSPNVAKVVRDRQGFALYFSRSTVPFDRDGAAGAYFKHIGIYVYSRRALQDMCSWDQTPLEQAECLEQLRALENGLKILCVETAYNPIGVDRPEDIARVVARLDSSRT
jgi:3-deoxy-manno-octulosonate cytidylyltransferase (CMP-KDO synthetase)